MTSNDPQNLELARQVEDATQQSPLDLSVATAHTSTDPLVLEIVNALEACLQEAGRTLNAALEMKHALLLLVKLFHDLCDRMEYRQQEWVWNMRVTVGGSLSDNKDEENDDHEGSRYNEPETVRELTGQIIIDHFEAAPWSLEKEPGQQRSNAVHAILATYAGMARFVQNMKPGFEKAAREGHDLSQFDVPEMRPEEDEEDEEDEPNALAVDDKSTVGTSGPVGNSSSAKEKRARRNPFPHQGNPSPWTDQERIALLKLYRDNPLTTNQQLTDLHMARASSVPKANRSVHSVQQEIGKQLGPGPKQLRLQGVQARIDKLEQ